MMKHILVLLFSLSSILYISAQHEGHTWILGRDSYDSDAPYGSMRIDFNDDTIIGVETIHHTTVMDRASGAYSDPKTGELLFYTDGFRLFNKDYEQLHAFDSINFTGWYQHIFGGKSPWGSSAYDNPVLLPSPAGEGIYDVVGFYDSYNFAETKGFTDSIMHTRFQIDENGLFHMYWKNKLVPLFNHILNNVTFCGATQHANGRDWWVILGNYPKLNSKLQKRAFHLLILNPSGLKYKRMVDDIPQVYLDKYFYSMTMNKLGSQFVALELTLDSLSALNIDATISLFNFDRCSGGITEVSVKDIGKMFDSELNYTLKQVFSPSGRFLYFIHLNGIVQYDLWAPDWRTTADTVHIIDPEIDRKAGLINDFSGFWNAVLGPDDRIYISAAHDLVPYLHVINKPDEKGVACDVKQLGIKLPYTAHQSVPPYINYNLGPIDGSFCDTLGIDVVSTEEDISSHYDNLRIYPNPISDGEVLKIELPEVLSGELEIYNVEGKRINQYLFRNTKTIDYTHSLEPGLYFLKVQSDGKVINDKIVVQ